MEKAYNRMIHLMANGWEFPDACFSAASACNVKYEALADHYDEMTDQSRWNNQLCGELLAKHSML